MGVKIDFNLLLVSGSGFFNFKFFLCYVLLCVYMLKQVIFVYTGISTGAGENCKLG